MKEQTRRWLSEKLVRLATSRVWLATVRRSGWPGLWIALPMTTLASMWASLGLTIFHLLLIVSHIRDLWYRVRKMIWSYWYHYPIFFSCDFSFHQKDIGFLFSSNWTFWKKIKSWHKMLEVAARTNDHTSKIFLID